MASRGRIMDVAATRLLASLGTFAIALMLATACGENSCPSCAQSACPPPFTLRVTDGATGQPLSGQATSPGLTCIAPSPGVVACAAGTAQATYDVAVSAPGYITNQVQVVVGPRPPLDACGCQPSCQSWQPGEVLLAQSPR
jgi:hypothetical protein